jgi:GTPase SAR1 family protein
LTLGTLQVVLIGDSGVGKSYVLLVMPTDGIVSNALMHDAQ